MKKPKFKIGQVIAQMEWEGPMRVTHCYAKVTERFWDGGDNVYRYQCTVGYASCPETDMRALTVREMWGGGKR